MSDGQLRKRKTSPVQMDVSLHPEKLDEEIRPLVAQKPGEGSGERNWSTEGLRNRPFSCSGVNPTFLFFPSLSAENQCNELSLLSFVCLEQKKKKKTMKTKCVCVFSAEGGRSLRRPTVHENVPVFPFIRCFCTSPWRMFALNVCNVDETKETNLENVKHVLIKERSL